MEAILLGLAVLTGLAVLLGVGLSVRAGRALLPEVLVVVGLLAIVAGGLSWGAWITSLKVDADVLAVRDGRCEVRWMDPQRVQVRTSTVDCPTSGEDAVGPHDTMIVKAQTGVLRGTAVAHSGPVTMLARFWIPALGTVLAVAGYQLVLRRRRSGAARRTGSILPR